MCGAKSMLDGLAPAHDKEEQVKHLNNKLDLEKRRYVRLCNRTEHLIDAAHGLTDTMTSSWTLPRFT